MNENLSSGSKPCEPAEYQSSKTPLSLGVSIYTPVSSVPGSSSFFFLQPLFTGKVFASVGILIAVQLFLFFAARFFGRESEPFQKSPIFLPGQAVQVSFDDLRNFLGVNIRPAADTSPSATGQAVTSPSATEQTIPGTISESLPEIPLVLALSVYGPFTNKPYTPSVFLQFPLFTFPNLRGTLPVLILELLTTIFVRSVVPPETTGAKPSPTQLN